MNKALAIVGALLCLLLVQAATAENATRTVGYTLDVPEAPSTQ